MRGRGWAAWGVAGVLGALLTGACGDRNPTAPEQGRESELPSVETPVPLPSQPVASADAGAPALDAGPGPVEVPDAGQLPDAGPWPADPVKDYTKDFEVG